MREYNFGSVDGRQLTLRFSAPFSMQSCARDCEFRFDWRWLFSPQAWWGAVRERDAWGCRYAFHRGATHRCYCGDGWLFDGRATFAGFAVVWFFSSYHGEIPCWCDKVIAERFPSEEVEAS